MAGRDDDFLKSLEAFGKEAAGANPPSPSTPAPNDPQQSRRRGSSPRGQFDDLIEEAARRYNVDPDLVKRIAKQESDQKPKAQSWAGASGVMQLMPSTARDLGVKNIWDPRENINGGVKYLRQMLDKYGGDVERALVAYNAGPRNASRPDWRTRMNSWSNNPSKKGNTTGDYVRSILNGYRVRGNPRHQAAPGTQPQGERFTGFDDLSSLFTGGSQTGPGQQQPERYTGFDDLSTLFTGGSQTGQQQQPQQQGGRPLFQPGSQSGAPETQQQPTQGGVSMPIPDPETELANAKALRDQTARELKTAKIPQRRRILIDRLRGYDSYISSLNQEIRARRAAIAQSPQQPPIQTGQAGTDSNDVEVIQYERREIKPGDKYYQFETGEKSPFEGGTYLGVRDGKHYAQDSDGDVYSFEEEGDGGRWKATSPFRAKLQLKDGPVLRRKDGDARRNVYTDDDGDEYSVDLAPNERGESEFSIRNTSTFPKRIKLKDGGELIRQDDPEQNGRRRYVNADTGDDFFYDGEKITKTEIVGGKAVQRRIRASATNEEALRQAQQSGPPTTVFGKDANEPNDGVRVIDDRRTDDGPAVKVRYSAGKPANVSSKDWMIADVASYMESNYGVPFGTTKAYLDKKGIGGFAGGKDSLTQEDLDEIYKNRDAAGSWFGLTQGEVDMLVSAGAVDRRFGELVKETGSVSSAYSRLGDEDMMDRDEAAKLSFAAKTEEDAAFEEIRKEERDKIIILERKNGRTFEQKHGFNLNAKLREHDAKKKAEYEKYVNDAVEKATREHMDRAIRQYGTIQNYMSSRRESERRIQEAIDRRNALGGIAGTPYTTTLQVLSNIGTGLMEIGTDLLSAYETVNWTLGIPTMGDLANAIRTGKMQVTPANERLLSQGSAQFRKWWEDNAYNDLGLQQYAILNDVPKVLTQVGVQVVAGMLTGGAAVPTMIGASQGMMERYREAIEGGADDASLRRIIAISAALAVPEFVVNKVVYAPLLKGKDRFSMLDRMFNMTSRRLYSQYLALTGSSAEAAMLTKETVRGITSRFQKAKIITRDAIIRSAKALPEYVKAGSFELVQETWLEDKINNAVAYYEYDRTQTRWNQVEFLTTNDIKTMGVAATAGVFGRAVSGAVKRLELGADKLYIDGKQYDVGMAERGLVREALEQYNTALETWEHSKKLYEASRKQKTQADRRKYREAARNAYTQGTKEYELADDLYRQAQEIVGGDKSARSGIPYAPMQTEDVLDRSGVRRSTKPEGSVETVTENAPTETPSSTDVSIESENIDTSEADVDAVNIEAAPVEPEIAEPTTRKPQAKATPKRSSKPTPTVLDNEKPAPKTKRGQDTGIDAGVVDTADSQTATGKLEGVIARGIELKRPDQPKKRLSNVQLSFAKPEAEVVDRFRNELIDPADVADKADLPSYAKDGLKIKPHITVKYGLKTNEVADVSDLFRGEKPITLTIGKTAVFPGAEKGPGYDVVIAEIDSPRLHELNKKITEKADVEPSAHPEYKPHITLAYVKKGMGEKYAGRTDLEGTKLTFDGVTFSPADKSGKVSIPFNNQKNAPVTGTARIADGSDGVWPDRRAKGKYTADGVTYERQKPIKQLVKGNTTEVRFATSLPAQEGHYAVIEDESLQPAHLQTKPNLLMFIPDAQPRTRTDAISDDAAARIAGAYDIARDLLSDNPYFGPPVVNERGEVIQGNNRSDGARRRSSATVESNREQLLEVAEQLGLDRSAIRKLRRPILVRMLPVDDDTAISLGHKDVRDLEAGGRVIYPVPHRVAALMSAEARQSMLTELFAGDLDASFTEHVNASRKLLAVHLKPYLNADEYATMFSEKAKTAKVNETLQSIVESFLFLNGDTNLPALFAELPHNIQQGLRKALPTIFGVPIEKSILPEIQNAIIAASGFRAINAASGTDFDTWVKQQDLFTENNARPLDTFTATELQLARVFSGLSVEMDSKGRFDKRSYKQTDIVTIFEAYAKLIAGSPANLFEEARPGVSKAEAIGQLLRNDPYAETAYTAAETPIEAEAGSESGPDRIPQGVESPVGDSKPDTTEVSKPLRPLKVGGRFVDRDGNEWNVKDIDVDGQYITVDGRIMQVHPNAPPISVSQVYKFSYAIEAGYDPRPVPPAQATFAEFADSLGIKRADMPQISRTNTPEFLQFAKDKGVTITDETVSVDTLKPTQNEYNPKQAAQLPTEALKKPLLVSTDNRVLDGHNIFVRLKEQGGDVQIRRINLAAQEALDLMRSFPKTTYKPVEHVGTTALLAEHQTTNPIDPNASQEEKARQLIALTEANKPIVEAITKRLRDEFGLTHTELGPNNEKEFRKIIEKANRAEVKAKKPWHDVEHIRDAFRFRAGIKKFEDIVSIVKVLLDAGVTIQKFDTAKMFDPGVWGWRPVAIDLIMPNGQMVEFYTSFSGLIDAQYHTDENHPVNNHDLYEKWRTKTADEIKADYATWNKDREDSWNYYQRPWEAALESLGFKDEKAAAASFTKAVASAESLIEVKTSSSSNAVGGSSVQDPSGDRRIQTGTSGGAYTTASPSPDLEAATNITTSNIPQESVEDIVNSALDMLEAEDAAASQRDSRVGSTNPDDLQVGDIFKWNGKRLRVSTIDYETGTDNPNRVTRVKGQQLTETGRRVIGKYDISRGSTYTVGLMHPDYGFEILESNETPQSSPSPSQTRSESPKPKRGPRIVIARPDTTATDANENEDNIIQRWWDDSLTTAGRKEILDSLGLRLPGQVLWQHLDPIAQSAIARHRETEEESATNKKTVEDDFLAALGEEFDIPLRSAISPDEQTEPETFDQERFERVKKIFEPAFQMFAGEDAKTAITNTLRYLKDKGASMEKLREMQPYIVRFMQEKYLPQAQNESINKVEVQDDTDRSDINTDRQGSDATKGSEDVSGVGTDTAARPSDQAASGSRDGDVSSDDTRGPGRDGTDAGSVSGESAEGNLTSKPSVKDSDRAGSRVSERGARRDYVAPVGSLARVGSWKQAAENNLNAIELAKKIESENRVATPDEQAVLVKFVGWGASELANNIFKDPNHYAMKPEWKDLSARMREVMTPEEIDTARRSTQYAHYTSEGVIRGMWAAFERFGFTGGTIIEPGMGIGLFPIAAPADLMNRSGYTGIEMDAMTARIAKLLLPDQRALEQDFIKYVVPDNFFDVAIGNPPFSATKIQADRKYKKYGFSLHDYFFAKSIDSVRPGGLLAFVTSNSTMDKQNSKAREFIAERADLVGAIRLPQTAFKQNAGTEVVTDVLFFRKRMPGEDPGNQVWTQLGTITARNEDGVDQTDLINQYFIDHPDMVLGEHSFTGSMYRENSYTVLPPDGNIEELFDEAVKRLPTGIYAAQGKSHEIATETAQRDWDPKAKKEGSLYIHDDGRLMQVDGGSGVALTSVNPKLTVKQQQWLKDYIGLRNALKTAQYDQLNAESKGLDWEKSLADLNTVYDAFVKKHGNISAFTERDKVTKDDDGNETVQVVRTYKNERLLSNDVEYPLVWALETITDDGEIVKSSVLRGRQIKPPEPPKIETIEDALLVSLDQIGQLSIPHVVETFKAVETLTEEDVVERLGNLVYEVPGGGWQMADEYLSGNVKEKLKLAQVAAATDPRFMRNVEALQDVQPLPLPPEKITIQLGAAWVPVEYVNQFAEEHLGIRGKIEKRYPYTKSPAVEFDPTTFTWTVGPAHGSGARAGRDAASEWGTKDRSPAEILELALNQKSTVIKTYDPDTKSDKVDKDAIAAVRNVIVKMNQAFKPFLYSDPERGQAITDIYNDKMNVMKVREFDGRHLTMPGLSVKFKIHDHVKRAVWRVIQTGNTYLAHAVGAGKTLEMIISAMEQKRLGKISKPMFIVPKHMLKQFSGEFLEAYPLANIMVADEQNFHTDNRRRFVAQAALNDLDAVIITHSAFGLLRTTEESSRAVLDELLEDLHAELEHLTVGTDSKGNRRGESMQETSTIKRIEKRIESIEQRFFGKMGGSRDNVLDFEELGVDFLYVDEAHEFRKLDFVTNQTNIKGIDPEGSLRALDLLVKSRWLEKQRPGRSMVLASGTPITNTMAELYTIQRFLGHNDLIADGLDHFDAWATEFGQVEENLEANAAGGYANVKRFSKFINTGVLMQRVRSFMDVLTLTQLGGLIKIPTVKTNSKGDHAPEVVVTQGDEALEQYLKGPLSQRIEKSQAWKPSPSEPVNHDPMIAIISDGQHAAFDMRFVDPSLPSNPNSKLNRMIDGILDSYHKFNDIEYTNRTTGEPYPIKGAAHIVFSFGGFGDQVTKNRGFDARSWLRKRLVEGGIPANEIAFITDYKSSAAKQALFKEVREGKKKVLIGSPKNMGTGVNAQLRLKTLHYGMAPWYPADVEQPHGRIIRQGNQNTEVELYWYAAKGTYDEAQWGMIARKAKAIEDAMSGHYDGDIEDISKVSQYAMASALASGDPRALRLATLRGQIEQFDRLEQAHNQQRQVLMKERDNIDSSWHPESIKRLEERLAVAESALKQRPFEKVEKDNLVITIGNKVFNRDSDAKISDIGNMLKAAWLKAVKDNRGKAIDAKEPLTVEVGKVFTFPLTVSIRAGGHGVTLTPYLKLTDGYNVRLSDMESLSEQQIDSSVSESGLVSRIYNAFNGLDDVVKAAREALAKQSERRQTVIDALNRPFESKQEAAEARAEYYQLSNEMAGDNEATKKDSDGIDVVDYTSVWLDVIDEAEGRSSGPLRSAVLASSNAFYSKAASVIAEQMPRKATGSQVLALLRKNGTKALDPEFVALEAMLSGTDGTISREDVLDIIDANRVNVETVRVTEPAFEQLQMDGKRANYQEEFVIVPFTATNAKWNDGHKQYADIVNPITRIRYADRVLTTGATAFIVEENQQPREAEFAKMPKVYQKFGEAIGWKLALHRAVTGGYEYFGWTSGDVQARRYALDEVIDSIGVDVSKDERTITVTSSEKGHTVVITIDGNGVITGGDMEAYIGEPLETVIGKGIAEQIKEQKVSGTLPMQSLMLHGNDLAARYDSKAVKIVNRIISKYGGQVTGGRVETSGIPEKVSLVRITPEIRQPILAGLPLFSKLHPNADESEIIAEIRDLAREEDISVVAEKTSATRHGDRIQVNPASAELYRRALEEASIRRGELSRGGPQFEELFTGVFMKPHHVRDIATVLREKAAEARAYGYPENVIAVFSDHAAMIEAAGQAGGDNTVILYTLESSIKEEAFHQTDYRATKASGLPRMDMRHTDKTRKQLDEHRVAHLLRTKYFTPLYPRYDAAGIKSTMRSEIPPFLLYHTESELEQYGITPEMRDDYLMLWFDGYVEKNGIESLEHFEKEELDVQNYTQRIREALAGRTGGVDNKVDKEDGQGRTPGNDERGPTGSSPPNNEQPGNRNRSGSADVGSSGDFSTDNPDVDDPSKTPGQRLRSLPATMRKNGIDAIDEAYDIYTDQAATADAVAILEENGIEGSISLLRSLTAGDMDGHHAILSFMVIRALQHRAADLAHINPNESQRLQNLSWELAREHAVKATQFGRFTRIPSVIGTTAETFMYAISGIIQDIADNPGAGLTNDQQVKFDNLGKQLEELQASLVIAKKTIRNQKAQIKRLQDKVDGKTPEQRDRGRTMRTRLAAAVITEFAPDNVHEIAEQLRQRLRPETVAVQRSIISAEPTLKSAIPEDDFPINDLSVVAAVRLMESLANDIEFTPRMFKAQILAEFGPTVEPYFAQIYKNAWETRDQWLSQMREKRRLDKFIEKNPGHDADEIQRLYEEHIRDTRARRARRAAIERYHRVEAKGIRRPKHFDGHIAKIAEIAADDGLSDAVAQVAAMFEQNLTPAQMADKMKALGIANAPAEYRDLIRQGKGLYDKAIADYKNDLDRAGDELLAKQAALQNMEDLRWQQRKQMQEVHTTVAAEIRRIKEGRLMYGFSRVVDSSNAMRTMMASLDLSGSLRQGGFFTFAFPELQKQAFVAMFKSVSEKGHGRVIQEIESQPLFILAQRAGMDFALAGRTADETDLLTGEELFRGKDFIESIPYLGPLVTAGITGWSERTYVGFLDYQRMMMFDIFARELMDVGMTFETHPKQFRYIAKFVNVATGRGAGTKSRLGRLLLDMPFFAPRYTLSRFQLLNMTINPVAYYNMPSGVRKTVAGAALRAYGTIGVILGLALAAGLTTLDPDDPDFLKIKIGSTRYDIMFGTLQPLRTLLRSSITMMRGNRIPGEVSNDILSNAGRFVRGKLSPAWSLGVDAFLGAEYNGEEFQWFPGKNFEGEWEAGGIVKRLIPLTIADAMEMAQHNGKWSVAPMLIPVVFGIGSSTYKDRFDKPTTPAERLAAKAVGMRMKSKPMTDRERKAREIVDELRAQARVGVYDAKKARQLVIDGKISESQFNSIKQAFTNTYLYDKAKSLPLDELIAVYRVANKQEREELKPLLETRVTTADSRNQLDPEKRSELAAMGFKPIGDVPMPDDVQKVLEQHGINKPMVSKSISIAKGVTKTLTPDEVERYRTDTLERVYDNIRELAVSQKYLDATEQEQKAMLQKVINDSRGSVRKVMKREAKRSMLRPRRDR